MDNGYINALAALGGAVVGSFTSFISSWTTVRVQMTANRRGRSKARRQKLYKAFIIDAARVYGDALVHSQLNLDEIIHLHAHISTMRVVSSQPVVDEADKIVRGIIETYGKPNLSLTQPVSWEESADLLRSFSEAARAEFELRLEV